MTDRQFGPFEIERQLGLGGMGVVYLARYKADGRDRRVALKVLSPGAGRRCQVAETLQS
jgi:serine/threonine protein kinase